MRVSLSGSRRPLLLPWQPFFRAFKILWVHANALHQTSKNNIYDFKRCTRKRNCYNKEHEVIECNMYCQYRRWMYVDELGANLIGYTMHNRIVYSPASSSAINRTQAFALYARRCMEFSTDLLVSYAKKERRSAIHILHFSPGHNTFQSISAGQCVSCDLFVNYWR